MPTPTAIGNGPIEFSDPDTGAMTVVPLSALSFDNTGALKISNPYNSPPALVKWLNYAASTGQIAPGPAAAPTPAMILKAAAAGASGNNITVTIGNMISKSDPTATKFDVTLTETDSYAVLTVDTVKGILGTDKKNGTQSGLVHLLDSDLPALPKPVTPAKPLAGGAVGAAASLPIPGDSSATAFTLQAKQPGVDGSLINVLIAVDKTTNPAKPTFSLTATWTQKITGVTIGTLPTLLQGLGYEVTLSVPDGGAFSVPAPGSYPLSGGADGAAPSTALAVIPSAL